MNNELTVGGLDLINSSLNDIKENFRELTEIVESFSKKLNISKEAGSFADELKNLSSALSLFSSAQRIGKDSIEEFNKSLTKMTVLGKIREFINKLTGDFPQMQSGAAGAASANTALAAATTLLTGALAQFLAKAGLITAVFLVFSKWDEMDSTMKTFTVTLGLVSAAVMLLGVVADTAFAPYVTFFALVSGGIAILSGLNAAITALFEGDYGKQVREETDEIKAQTDAVKEQISAYDDLKEKRKESGYEILAQSQMYKNMSDELSSLNDTENQSAEQQERMKYLTEQLNKELGSNISLREENGRLIVEGNEDIDQYIQKLQSQAMAEVVAAEYKQAYTEAFKNANEINKLLAEESALNAKLESGEITSAERAKLKAIQENLEERKVLQEEFNTDILELENMQYQASIGNTEALTEAFMLNTDIRNESAKKSTRDREEIEAMMYDTLSAQEQEALVESLLRIQENGGDITQFLDDNGKLRKDINLAYLKQINSDITAEGNIAADNSQESGKNVALGYGEGINEEKINAQQAIEGLAAGAINAGNNAFEINSPSKVFERMGKYVVEGLNSGISEMTSDTEDKMGDLTKKVTNAFNGKKLPKLKGTFHDERISGALAKIAGLFGFSATPRLTIQKMALGGMVEPGELFLAREAGPELVGTIGTHTAVMNNNQIVVAVSNGVYKATTKILQKNKLSLEQLKILTALKRAY